MSQLRNCFYADCGTSLTYEAPDGIALSIVDFDHPQCNKTI